MTVNYTNILHFVALQNIPNFGILCLKINRLATVVHNPTDISESCAVQQK
jgi:hypothetical protein